MRARRSRSVRSWGEPDAVGRYDPYGRDPRDRNLRIAPTYPTVADLKAAMEVLCVCARLVYNEKAFGEITM